MRHLFMAAIRGYLRGMHNFVAILSQLFWGVTVGALGAAFELLAKGVMMVGGFGGAGWYGLRWHRARKLRNRRD